MSDVLAALAGPVVGALGNIGLGALSRSWEQEDWTNRTSVMNQYARENAVLDPMLKVRGMKLAGLNPALANGGSFSGLAPAQGTTSSTPLSMHAPDFSMLAQNSLIEAQANKTNAEAQKLNIEVGRELDKDQAANARFRASLETWLKKPKDSDDYLSARWLLDQNEVFSLGTIEGVERAELVRNVLKETRTKDVVNEFIKQVHQAKLDKDCPKMLAEMDAWQLRKFAVDLAETQSRILAIGANIDETRANIGKIVAETADIIKETGLKDYQSFAQNVESGHGLRASLILLDKSLMALAGTAPLMIPGFGNRKALGRLAPTTEKAFRGLTRFDSNSSVKPKL